MKNIIFRAISIALLCSALPLLSYCQKFSEFGHTLNEVYEFHQTTEGVKNPTTTTLKTGAVVLDYQATNDKGIGLQGFSYLFKDNICTQMVGAYTGNFEYVFRQAFNEQYQKVGENKWVDTKNGVNVEVEMQQNGFFVFYTKL